MESKHTEIIEKHTKWLRGEGGKRADLRGADLSGAEGLFDAVDYLMKNFERTAEGYIVYKTFGSQFPINPAWEIKPGSVIKENVNPCPTFDCGCGINLATLDWVKRNHQRGDIWKCLIRFEWLPTVVIPWGTDGKIRVNNFDGGLQK